MTFHSLVDYCELVEVVIKDPLCRQLSLSATKLCSFWSWVPVADYISNTEVLLTWRLIQNVLFLNDVAFRGSWANLPNCHQCDFGLEETALHTYYCHQMCPFWNYVSKVMTHIDSEQYISINLSYVCDNVPPLFSGVEMDCVSDIDSHSKNGGMDVADEGNIAIQTLFSSGSC